MWFKDHNIDTSAYENILITGHHLQIAEFENVCIYPIASTICLINSFFFLLWQVLDTGYKGAIEALYDNLDATCSKCN